MIPQKVLFAWHRNGWQPYSWFWWRHWFDWAALLREGHAVWRRGWYGYAPRDLWSLDAYLATWLPYAIKEFRERNNGHPCDMASKQWDKELRAMEAGWIAARHILEQCGHACWTEKGHGVRWEKQWNSGSKIFMKRFFHLWY